MPTKMTTMITNVYEALVEAGAPKEKAKEAAESIAAYEDRFNQIESDLNLVKWMLGFIIVGVLALVVKTFFI